MSFQITEAFVKDFTDGITVRAQQFESRLRSRVRVESGIVGTEASFDHVGKRRPTKRTTRHGDTVLSDTPHDRRWVGLDVYDDADLIDKPDLVRTLTDPTNAYTRSMTAGFGRLIDEILMDVCAIAAKTGVDGASTSALNTDHFLPVAASGLDLTKMLTTSRLLNKSEIGDNRHWAITSYQLHDLLGEEQVRSSDYAVTKVLTTGMVESFMGFRFVRVEDPILKLDGSGDRKTYAWDSQCLLLGLGSDVSGSIDRRPDKKNSTQIFYSCDLGAVRMDDNGIVEIICDEP